jgi:hypothetical protein
VFLLGLCASAFAAPEEPLSPKERDKRIAEAKKKIAEEDRAFAKAVNEAIDKGHDWLKGKLGSGGLVPPSAWPNDPQGLGRQALVLYTLAKCGSSPKSKEIKAAMGGVENWLGKIKNPGWGLKTYSVAILILAYDAVYRPKPKPGKQRSKKKLKLPKDVRAMIQDWAAWLEKGQRKGSWRYPGSEGGFEEDLSHAQYVLLALQTAADHGIEVDKDVYLKALAYVLELQEDSGPEVRLLDENPAWLPGIEDKYGRFLPGMKAQARGWPYLAKPGTAMTGSMTTAGMACLAIIKARLLALEALDKDTRSQIDGGLRSGLAWLQRRFDVSKNPGQGGWHYYYLYGLERVGALLGIKHVGEHDWYREGAEFLISKQTGDGNWPRATDSIVADHEDEIIQTCFALLFLKRATVPPAVPLGPVVTGD